MLRMRLIFTCCHPALPPDARAALTLREVCGLSTEEVARAFLAAPSTLQAAIAAVHAARADLCRRLGRTAEARASYERGLALARQDPERRFLERRLREPG
jgi:predicted RNA polymerase sigma factor